MPQELIHLNLRRPLLRVAVILVLIAATGFSYVALRWYIGNTLAENFTGDENALNVGRLATSMTPKDPLAHWRLGSMWERAQPVVGLQEAIGEYEKAVSLSPNDYRYWIALGIAQERAGDPVKGEHAIRKAISLAPSYAIPRWYLGNLLVRSGKYDEAFAELLRASDAYPEFTPQLFNIVWAVYGADYDSISKALGNRAYARANFALYLANRGSFDEGLQMWSRLTPAERSDNKATGEGMIGALVHNRRFYDAMNVWNDIAPHASSRAVVDQIGDGSFEELSNYGPEMAFGWQIRNRQIQIDIDPSSGYNSRRSLRMLFQSRAVLDALIATRLITVTPDKQYELQFYVKSEKLHSGATPFIQVLNANDNEVLASSTEAPTGDKDWQPVSVQFTTPSKTQAVIIQIVRGKCVDTEVCPIFGTLWYDDFSLKRRN